MESWGSLGLTDSVSDFRHSRTSVTKFTLCCYLYWVKITYIKKKKDFVSFSKKGKLLAVAVNGRQLWSKNTSPSRTEPVYQIKGAWPEAPRSLWGIFLKNRNPAHSPKLRLSLEIVRSRQKKRNSSPGLQHHWSLWPGSCRPLVRVTSLPCYHAWGLVFISSGSQIYF